MNTNMDIEEFTNSLTALKDYAALSGGFVTEDDINDAFPGLTDEQYTLIKDYLNKNRIGIGAPLDADTFLTEDDNKYLDMYLEDLKGLDDTSDDMKRVLTMNVLQGDASSKEKLINAYLKNVVDIAKLYAGQGVLMADLIGEGNVALAICVDMLGCVDTPEDADALIVRHIMNAMEDFAAVESDAKESEKKALATVVKVTDKAREMNEELLRKVSVDELANECGISKKKILDAIRVSKDCLEYIEQPEEKNE